MREGVCNFSEMWANVCACIALPTRNVVVELLVELLEELVPVEDFGGRWV